MSERPIASEVADALHGKREEHQKQRAVDELCKARGITLTEVLTEPSMGVKNRLMRAVTGLRYDAASGHEVWSASPLVPTARLRSKLTSCPDCKADRSGACKRKQGEFHGITYKTGLIEGNAHELRRIANQDGTVNEYAYADADPKTGDFIEAVQVGEALKILKQFGVGVVHARKKAQGVVIEIAHLEKYASNDTNAARRPVKATSVKAA